MNHKTNTSTSIMTGNSGELKAPVIQKPLKRVEYDHFKQIRGLRWTNVHVFVIL